MPEKIIVKAYKGKQGEATAEFQADARVMAAHGYIPVSQTWVPGSWGCGAFLVAALLVVIVVGIIVFIYMLIVKPAGTLTVTYEYRGVEKVVQAQPEKKCPKCAEIVKAAATVCRYCRYEFPPVDVTDAGASAANTQALGATEHASSTAIDPTPARGSAARGRLYIGLFVVVAIVAVIEFFGSSPKDSTAGGPSPATSKRGGQPTASLPVPAAPGPSASTAAPKSSASLGRWRWNSGHESVSVEIRKDGAKLISRESFTDGPNRTLTLKETSARRGGRRFINADDTSLGEYFLIMPNGDLEIGDKDGRIGTTTRLN
jgi:hypothetical protein